MAQTLQWLREHSGATVVLVEQDADLVARFADRLVVLVDGKVKMDGSPRALFLRDRADRGRRSGAWPWPSWPPLQPARGDRLPLLVTHDLRLVSHYAEHLAVLEDGALLAMGPTRQVLSQFDRLSVAFPSPPPLLALARTLAPDGLTGRAPYRRGDARRHLASAGAPAMSQSFDLYVERDSWLHRLDPRVKLVFAALSLTGCCSAWPTCG